MVGIVAVLLWFAFMALLCIRFSHQNNHGVITNGLDDLKVDLRPNVDRCHYCGRVNILATCEGCGAPNPYWTPRAKTEQRRETDVDFKQQVRALEDSVAKLPYRSVGEGMIAHITQAMEQAAFIPPVIFGEEDCDVDEMRGDNNAVLARASRCRERVGPLPLPVSYSGFIEQGTHYPERTSRYVPYGCREGERCVRWADNGYCDQCMTYEYYRRDIPPLGPSNKIYR